MDRQNVKKKATALTQWRVDVVHAGQHVHLGAGGECAQCNLRRFAPQVAAINVVDDKRDGLCGLALALCGGVRGRGGAMSARKATAPVADPVLGRSYPGANRG